MFTIALRRLFIVEEALPYPEGVACREVLVAVAGGGDGALAIVYAWGIGGLYGTLLVSCFGVTHHTVEGAVSFISTRLYAGMDLSVALLSVGYIVGIRIASFIFDSLGLWAFVPMYGWIYGWPAGGSCGRLLHHLVDPVLRRGRKHGGRWYLHALDHEDHHHHRSVQGLRQKRRSPESSVAPY